MHALYVHRPTDWTHDHVREAFDIGAIDTVLLDVDVTSILHEPTWHDTWNFSVGTLRMYHDMGIDAYPVMDWQERGLPADAGLNLPQARIRAARQMMDESGSGAVVWDTEDYRRQEGKSPQRPMPDDFVRRCHDAGLPVLGGMPGALAGTWFTEDTYDRNRWWRVKLQGWTHKIVAGGFIEVHEDPAKYIRTLRKCYRHTWIYSHVLFGQRMINPRWEWYVVKPGTVLSLKWWEKL